MRARLAAILVGLLVAGCHSEDPGIQVEVRPEPKTGYTPPDDGESPYGGAGSATTSAAERAFSRINYRHMTGIAVYIEPISESGAAAPPNASKPLNSSVDLHAGLPAAPDDFQLASVGGSLSLADAREPKYLLRAADGALVDASPDAATTLSKPGLIEVLSETRDEPMASVYVAPSAWAKKVRGGEKATFSPLPPGKYRVTTWHPILPGSTQTVDVVAGQLSKVTLTVGVNSLPKPK